MKNYSSKITFFLILLLSLVFIQCKEQTAVSSAEKAQNLIAYVNPFIGTGGHGHTYPGASMPYGMMQLSPDTRLDGWDGCSGYHYTDEHIYGFSHTHLSGTGVSDYGDVLLMPTNEIVFNNGADEKKGYRSHFSHKNEIAEAGFYKVHLDDTDIDVELTVDKRSGMHQYAFPDADKQFLILELDHRDELLSGNIEIVSATEIKGHRHSKAWAEQQFLYYHIQLSHPIDGDLVFDDAQKPSAAAIKFVNPNNEAVFVKVGISAVDEEGALKNLTQEIGDKSFAQVKENAQSEWEKQLSKIVIESDNTDYKTNFYSAMYHAMLAPNLYEDVDGRYRGMDLEIHTATDFDYYTVFSLWDTYRAAKPLFTILEPSKTSDFINTFLAKYDEGGIMPIWDLSANYTGCMIGYHAVPVIADAYLKGIRGFDAEKAMQAMRHSATRDKLGLESYKKMGYIPVENESESVSKVLEYAYDDWTIAQMAKAMGKSDVYEEYIQRAQYYKNIFDPATQFMRGRFRNTWFAPFDPYEVNFNYTEANSWQYSYYVPQDVSGYIDLLGGKDQLETHLDKLFAAEDNTSGAHQVDITGLIGQYAHGNEPSHHIAYLYNFVNKPHKTQEKIHQILTELYTNTPDGVSGNEDCGQMSAWYIFSSLGFYPVTPASNEYIIGTPLFPKASINLESGKQFTVQATNLSASNIYIQSATLNGKALNKTYISHKDIMQGGTLAFVMTNKPSEWGTKAGQEPVTAINDHLIVSSPFIAKGQTAFTGSTQIELASNTKNARIFYALNDTDFQIYKQAFSISEAGTLKVYSELDNKKSPTITTEFFKIDPNLNLNLATAYASRYNAGGDKALIDGVVGAKDFRTGTWQGYEDKDVIATVDLGRKKVIQSVHIGFLQDQRSWIFYPTEVQCFVSKDGKNFKPFANNQKIDATIPSEEVDIKNISFSNSGNYRYVKVIAKKLGVLPEWHLGYKHDGRSWIFVDEISVR